MMMSVIIIYVCHTFGLVYMQNRKTWMETKILMIMEILCCTHEQYTLGKKFFYSTFFILFKFNK